MLTATAIVSILSPSPLKSVPPAPVVPSLARKARLCAEIAIGVVPATETVVLVVTKDEVVSLLELQPASAATRSVRGVEIRIGCMKVPACRVWTPEPSIRGGPVQPRYGE